MDTDSAMRIPLTSGRVALIDAADFERQFTCSYRDGSTVTCRPCDYRWHLRSSRWNLYAQTLAPKRHLYLHRLIVQAGPHDLSDHVNGDGLDCRRSNLRIATPLENSRNQRKPRGNYRSTFKGVRQVGGKFQSLIRIGATQRSLGVFVNEEDAARAYDRAALELFGEFARLNFPSHNGVCNGND